MNRPVTLLIWLLRSPATAIRQVPLRHRHTMRSPADAPAPRRNKRVSRRRSRLPGEEPRDHRRVHHIGRSERGTEQERPPAPKRWRASAHIASMRAISASASAVRPSPAKSLPEIHPHRLPQPGEPGVHFRADGTRVRPRDRSAGHNDGVISAQVLAHRERFPNPRSAMFQVRHKAIRRQPARSPPSAPDD